MLSSEEPGGVYSSPVWLFHLLCSVSTSLVIPSATFQTRACEQAEAAVVVVQRRSESVLGPALPGETPGWYRNQAKSPMSMR